MRDIVIRSSKIKWEIGLSIKHNNFSIKHSRLSNKIDFGNKWYGIPCSINYWERVNPIFAFLDKEHEKKTLFSALNDKMNIIYKPLVGAFIEEIRQQYATHHEILKQIVEYVLSKYDFYMIESVDRKRMTLVKTFNLHNSLNQSSKSNKPKIIVPRVSLPTRIVHLDYFPHRYNTAEMILDKGWSFTFRIHNGDKVVKSSLKFDIKIISMPIEVLTIKCDWQNEVD